MSLATSIFLVTLFVGIIMLIVLKATHTYFIMSDLSQEIIDDTEFYFKHNPIITSKIIAIQRIGWAKPNVVIEVTYPDRTTGELTVTLADFQEQWLKSD